MLRNILVLFSLFEICCYLKCLELFKKKFIELLTSLVSASNHTKCVSLNNQKCEIQPNFINLHPHEYC